MSTFNGFSEEDIEKLKLEQSSTPSDRIEAPSQNVKMSHIGSKPRRPNPQYKLQNLIDDKMDEINISFDKCKLSFNAPIDDASNEIKQMPVKSQIDETNERNSSKTIDSGNIIDENDNKTIECSDENCTTSVIHDGRSPDEVHGMSEKGQSAKLEELQIKQKLMEEQNRKRKEMLAKALADRAKQTEEEVLRLEKIRRELHVLDGQFSQDVGVLRKKIDQASLTYAEAEKQYLRVEKEFLQAKLNLQKEKEKKELLSEHLCALIMHNETRKAQKLVTLMQELAHSGTASDEHDNSVNKIGNNANKSSNSASKVGNIADKNANSMDDSTDPIIVDGVDERTGKMIEVNEM